MAATGYSPIQLYYSTTASAAPTAGNLASGELAINITDGKLYYKDNAGAVQLLSTSTTANGTANGVLYLNGSKVATAGTALVFDGTGLGIGTGTIPAGRKLVIDSGNIRLSNDYQIEWGGATVGLYGNGSTNSLSFFTNTSEQMRLTSTGLGIKLSSPDANLNVNGYSGNGTLRIGGGTTGESVLYFADSGSGVGSYAGFLQYLHSSDNLVFGAASAEQMRLTSTGLGIGTSSPAQKLDVLGSIAVRASTSGANQDVIALRALNSDNTAYANAIYYANSHRWAYAGATEGMRLDSSGNLGIGTSSPSTKLHVAGTVVSNQGVMKVQDLGGSGTSAYPVIALYDAGGTHQGDLGMFAGDQVIANLTASGKILFKTNSTTVGTLDSSGNLGLGVTPSAGSTHIDVSAGGSFYGLGNGAQLAANSNFSSGSWLYRSSAFASRIDINPGNAGGVAFYTAASGTAGNAISFTQAMTLDASGNLLVGATSADARVFAYSSSGTSFKALNPSNVAQLLIGYNNTSYNYMDADNNIFRSGNGTERARIDSSGNLGLGVTPSAWGSSAKAFQLSTTGSFWGVAGQSRVGNNHYFDSGSAFRYLTTGAIATDFSQTSGGFFWSIAPSGTAGNAITFTQAMTLDASGRLGIGATSLTEYLTVKSPNASTFFSLQTATDSGVYMGNNVGALTLLTASTERARIDSSGRFMVGKTSFSATTTGFQVNGDTGSSSFGSCTSTLAATANANTTYEAYSTGASAYRFYVGMGGTVYATSTTITAISDQRLKENIRDLDDGLASVMSLKPRKFDWKEGKGANIKDARGFIAQEFETVFPDMIEEWRDPAPEGEEPYKAINANLIPTLVKAIQEQQAQIESLRKRLADAGIA